MGSLLSLLDMQDPNAPVTPLGTAAAALPAAAPATPSALGTLGALRALAPAAPVAAPAVPVRAPVPLPVADGSRSPPAPTSLGAMAAPMFTPRPPDQVLLPVAPIEGPALPPPAPFKGPGGTATSADNQAALERSYARQEQAIDTGGAAEQRKREYVAAELLRADQQRQADQAALDKDRVQAATEYKAKIAGYDAELKTLAGQTPDARRLWKDKSTLEQILLAISVGLGGYGMRNTGGRNLPLEMIQAAVERDVTAQARDYAQKLDALKERRSGSREEYAAQLSEVEWKQTRLIDAYSRVQSMIDVVAGKYFDQPVYQARRDELKAKLEESKVASREQLRHTAETEALDRVRTGIAGAGLAEQVRSNRVSEQMRADQFDEQKRQFDITTLRELASAKAAGNTAMEAVIKDERERAIFAVKDPLSGRPLLAPVAPVAAEINKKIGAADEMYRAIDEIGRLKKQVDLGQVILGGPEERRVNALMGNLKTAYSKLTEQGVITTGDAGRMDKELSNPTSIKSLLRNIDQLRELQGITVDKVNTELRARTDNPAATWRGDADPDYATTVRPPGYVRATVKLPRAGAAGDARQGGRRLSPEAYQQVRARESSLLGAPSGAGPAPNVGQALVDGARRRALAPSPIADLNDPLGLMAIHGDLFGR